MSEAYSKSRQQAENAFSKVQTQATARQRVLDEIETVAAERQAKNARLREARLAKERQEQSAPTPTPASRLSARRTKV